MELIEQELVHAGLHRKGCLMKMMFIALLSSSMYCSYKHDTRQKKKYLEITKLEFGLYISSPRNGS